MIDKREMNSEEMDEYLSKQRRFSERLTELRQNMDVSSRDMSLSLGQSPSYINNIENGINMPSMTAFFYICEYLGVSPEEFFSYETQNPVKARETYELVRNLNEKQQDLIQSLIIEITKHR